MLEDLFNTGLPLILAMLAFLGGISTYIIQKSVDRRDAIASMRADFYTEFLDTWQMRHIGKPTPEIEAQYSRLRLRLYVVSSDEVIRSFYDVSSFLNEVGRRSLTKNETEVVKRKIAKMILAIRKDCYEKSQLHLDELTEFMPFKGSE